MSRIISSDDIPAFVRRVSYRSRGVAASFNSRCLSSARDSYSAYVSVCGLKAFIRISEGTGIGFDIGPLSLLDVG